MITYMIKTGVNSQHSTSKQIVAMICEKNIGNEYQLTISKGNWVHDVIYCNQSYSFTLTSSTILIVYNRAFFLICSMILLHQLRLRMLLFCFLILVLIPPDSLQNYDWINYIRSCVDEIKWHMYGHHFHGYSTEDDWEIAEMTDNLTKAIMDNQVNLQLIANWFFQPLRFHHRETSNCFIVFRQ